MGRVNSTDTTPAPAVGGRQVGQLLAGRYRLAMFKGGDDIADVWHALDETTEKVVTLEILRDRDNEAARQRFLAEAQRMAAIERPSVMRVAAIHNEAADTFIVFEHLIPLPVVLTGLTAVAKDVRPATQAAADKDKTVVITPAAPQAPAPVTPTTLTAVAGPKRSAAPEPNGDDAAPTIVELDELPQQTAPSINASTARLPDTLQAASRSLRAAQSDMSLVVTTATEIVDDVRRYLRALHLDALVASVRARMPQRLDTSALTSFAARMSTRARELTKSPMKSRVPVDREAKATRSLGNAGGSALSNATAIAMSVAANAVPLVARAASSAAPLIGRARGNRIAMAGAGAALLLAVVVISPLDDMVASAFRPGPAAAPTAAPTSALRPAPFEVPPLAAYAAAFDSQGAYPTTTPNGTVEWVVALRNTGSAGWYRGVEGAQAALALPNGAGVAVQSTDYVAPGQVGWFVVRFKARAEVGTYTVQLLPRIDGRGPLPDLGIHAVVTVSKNP